ncbi:MAG: DEAD/DEAH box helicase [Desulfovibrionaceae bacterium]
MQTIQETIEQLHGALRDYIEATYHISAKSLIARRKELLDQPGVIHQTPYLESTPRYQTGKHFVEMEGLPPAALEAYLTLSKPNGDLPRLIYDPPYKHQSEAIRGSLIDERNLIIMTGTGSGKTESFLLPILGKLAREAKEHPQSFGEQPAMRALILYPMNALVNDQLGRLRALFGDPRLVTLFKGWAGRPPRFARYTSRTPYAGIRTSKKDSIKLNAFDEFYADNERKAQDSESEEQQEAQRLLQALRERGKWPAKPSLAAWFGDKGSRWQNSKTGKFVRAITLPDDSELLTRHEVQAAPPDLLVTNYSMLEYMLMRPIERPIFDRTHAWLEDNPDEKFLVVLDEAHLYRGAAGAEVALLLRRLRDRLGIPTERFQVICATASFHDHGYAPQFGAQLSGLPPESFNAISGDLNLMPHEAAGSDSEAEVLARIDLQKYYDALDDAGRLAAIRPLLDYRHTENHSSVEATLYHALVDFGPMSLLVNTTMKQAVPISELGRELFPTSSPSKADAAVTVLMSLGSIARLDPKTPGLLPCRIHSFFRGLPGLWVCMDPDCSEIDEKDRDGICGKMYSQPRERCKCGARVLELYTCRNCGTAYARAYTDDVDAPSTLWSEPGQNLRMADGETSSLLPLDLLLEPPTLEDVAEPADYDLETGRLNPSFLGQRNRRVYIRSDRVSDSTDEENDSPSGFEMRAQFVPCAVCGKAARFGRTYVQDHQTKGDQPFQALVARQIQIQPPAPVAPTRFAPLQGRKVLTFSDSRQVAARLAPNLQMYSVRDSLRPLIAWGYRRLQAVSVLQQNLNLEDLYLAVLLASKSLNVRLRPEMKAGESFGAELTVENAVLKEEVDDAGLLNLCMEIRNERPPEALLDNIITTVQDRFLGFEALALASIAERNKHTVALETLPPIPGVAETPEAKVGLARAWLRCWQNYGFWLSSMPPVWWRRPRSEGVSIRGHKGKFKAMDKVLTDKAARKVFWNKWSPSLLALFTQDSDNGFKRLRGSELTLLFEGQWVHCASCKSVHRPIPGIGHCLDCGSQNIRELDPALDPVFNARKGFYRKPVIEALGDPPRQPMALIAGEHTAQLNAPQNEDVFSKSEENELLFQDIALGGRNSRSTAIDVLSSTTTMEVGIDIGALSGVALRNMPPGRANYQQRSGRAGRRGSAVATVVAFGSADSHDEHYFSEPDGMIRGDVIDPKLTLDNREIVRRHIRAFLLQNYHQDRLPEVDPSQRHDLFSVLGTVSEFRNGTSILNRDDFAAWLNENEKLLRNRVSAWIPMELSQNDREELLEGLAEDCLKAVDDAIRAEPGESNGQSEIENDIESEDTPETGEVQPLQASRPEKLLDRLLYCGKLPRYAFPIDVATFHVFDRGRSTRFRPIMRFAPQQSLPVALTQYAPGKQVWISGKCYTSGAIYSVMSSDRYVAWESKRIYMECSECGFAKTFAIGEADRNKIRDCEACGGKDCFGPGRYWLRPPGFAHPIDLEEATSPTDIPETSYATRAKLTMGTPDEEAGWVTVNDRIRALRSRQHLLVSNSGPRKEGYTYCTKCGRIEASTEPSPLLGGQHRKPYPEDDDKLICDGISPARHIVLGTDFITDIALFSVRVDEPLSLKPGHTSTLVALRTVSEALAKAASQLLEIEPGELMAEFRPALTPNGIKGLEAEIFLYDTLPGGAGFSSQLANQGLALFQRALSLMQNCPENCDASCYRCLRSFKNKFEHSLLDRHVGVELLEYLLTGELPGFNETRLTISYALLYNDLARSHGNQINFRADAEVPLRDGRVITVPILAEHNGNKFVIALSGPLTWGYPVDLYLSELCDSGNDYKLIVESELAVRDNLAYATRSVFQQLNR